MIRHAGSGTISCMDLASSYSAVASDYAEKILDELKGKPKDRELLDQFALMSGGAIR